MGERRHRASTGGAAVLSGTIRGCVYAAARLVGVEEPTGEGTADIEATFQQHRRELTNERGEVDYVGLAVAHLEDSVSDLRLC